MEVTSGTPCTIHCANGYVLLSALRASTDRTSAAAGGQRRVRQRATVPGHDLLHLPAIPAAHHHRVPAGHGRTQILRVRHSLRHREIN